MGELLRADFSPGVDTTRFVHAPRGIHAMETPAGAWTYAVQDGLGSVRIDGGGAASILGTRTYAPFGSPFSTHGTFAGGFGFTGEQVDSSGQVYLRARYYNPSLSVFPSLDPFEGTTRRPMSLNGYAWVEGNAPNWADPSGQRWEPAFDEYGEGAALPPVVPGLIQPAPLRLVPRPPGQPVLPRTPVQPQLQILPRPQTQPQIRILPPSQLQTPSLLGSPFPRTPSLIQPPTIPQPLGGISLSGEAGSNALEIAETCNQGLCENPSTDTEEQLEHACHKRLTGRTLTWPKLVNIPLGVTVGQIISSSTAILSLPLPPFLAGQHSVDKHGAECLASAMILGISWENFYHFTFGRYQGTMIGNTEAMFGYDDEDFLGHWVLLDGHTRLIGWLISGIPPLSPISINYYGLSANVYPWHVVWWS